MKTFYCRCGHRVFFDNTECNQCGSLLGFDPQALDIVPVDTAPGAASAGPWRLCENRVRHAVCNWLVPAHTSAELCLACGMNEVIPNLDSPGNLRVWSRLEAAKRRLLYALMRLNLPVVATATEPGLRFRFLEDQRHNPAVLEPFVMTGHVRGTITINAAEADDVKRHEIRESMQENYRTLLGHFRHEAGHYYFESLVPEGDSRDEFRELFGDERRDYEEALAKHYQHGAPPDWPDYYVSAYASAHPHEDWAESFAHYLHIQDALETADQSELVAPDNGAEWIVRWMELAVTLNELNRSLGTEDPYPFVLPDPVAERLRFIDRRIGPAG